MRDHRKLKVFEKADALVLLVYQATRFFPAEERFGLSSQLRRAVMSIASNIVEGSARSSRTEYCRFLEMAHASAREVQYQLSVAGRLGYFEEIPERPEARGERYEEGRESRAVLQALSLVDEVCRMLSKLHQNLEAET